MTQEKELLQNIYDALAHNTQYVSPDEISSRFDMEVDFDHGTITMWGLNGEGAVTLRATFESE